MPLKKAINIRQFILGTVITLMILFFGCILYLYLNTQGEPIAFAWYLVKKHRLFGEMMTIASAPAVLLFFITVRMRKDDFAKGVLLTYICIALAVFTVKFII